MHPPSPHQSTKRVFWVALIGLLFSLVSACSKPPEPLPFREIVGTKLLMAAVVDPSADVVWEAVKSIVTEEGIEEIAPETDEEWIAVRNAAVVLGESGNLLMLERRAKDHGDWLLWSLDLVDAGNAAMLAAEARDAKALFDAGGVIYEACLGCHENYWLPGSGNVMPERP